MSARLDEPDMIATRAYARMAEKIEAAREDVNDFIELIGEVPGGGRMMQDPAHRRWQEFWEAHRKSVLLAPIGHGKCLPEKTAIATPQGWRPIGELRPGDEVLGGDGKPTAVTYRSPTYTDHEIWELTFDDGSTIRADSEHQWLAWAPGDTKKGKAPQVITTARMVAKHRRRSTSERWELPLPGAAAYDPRALDVQAHVEAVSTSACPVGLDYLLGSIEQRDALLCGLAGDRLSWEAASEEQAETVLELVRSLGFWATRDRLEVRWSPVAFTKSLVRAKRVETEPMCCIAVEAEHHTYIATRSYIVTHNTSQLRHRLLWKVGKNQNLQIAYISATERHPKRVLRAWKTEIERNPRVRWVFPDLKRGKVWTTTDVEVVRETIDPNPTFQIYPAFSQSVLGSRADIVVFDDLCNYGNTLTEYARDKMAEWIGEVISRLRPEAEVMAIGHIWHDKDQLQRLRRLPGWGYRRDEAYRVDKKTGKKIPLAPRVMSLAAIEDKTQDLGAVQAEMMLFNRMPSRSMGRFKESMFDRCLSRGQGLSLVSSWRGSPTYTGVDLGFTKNVGSDWTVMFTCALLPGGNRQVIDIRYGKWSGTEIVRELRDVQQSYGSTISVETNGGANLLVDLANDLECLAISPHHTSQSNKWSIAHGVETLARELDSEKWILPCDQNRVPSDPMARAIDDCMVYSPKRHVGDFLMAWWICREAIRQSPAAQPGMELPSRYDLLSR